MSGGRIFLRRRHARPAYPTARPLAAVILALDSARTSGLAVYVGGKLILYGECEARDPQARIATVTDALAIGRGHGLPVGMAIEVPYGGRINTVLSLTATATLWRDTWRQLGQAANRVIERRANEWRPMVGIPAKTQREPARRLEAVISEQIAARDMPGTVHRIGPDAAAAICIGQTVLKCAELQVTLGCALR